MADDKQGRDEKIVCYSYFSACDETLSV